MTKRCFMPVALAAAIAAAAACLSGCPAPPSRLPEKPSSLTLVAAAERIRRHLGEIRASEMLRMVAAERFDRRRQIELPGLLAHADAVGDELKLRVLDEARNYCALLSQPEGSDIGEIQRRITDRQLDFELASRFCRLAALTGADGNAESYSERERRRREVELELAISLGIPSRELPVQDFSSLPGADAPLPAVDPEFTAFIAASASGWDDPGAELRFARLLFRLPGELALREIAEPGLAIRRIAGLADRIGAGFQQRLLLRAAAAASRRLREARGGGDRSGEAAALLDFRLARYRLTAVDPGAAVDFTAAERGWLRDLALLIGE